MKTYKQNCFYRHRWQCLVFLSEFIYMGLELNASRIMSPAFGTTLDIWSSIIGIILASSAIGNWLAGHLSDRAEIRHIWIVRCLFICAFWLAFVPILYASLINSGLHANLPHIVAALIACIALFMIPGICIGMLTPLVLAQYADEQKLEIGRASSGFYAAMTLGGLAGTFATGFYLVPTLGSNNLTVAMSIAMAILGILSATILRRLKAKENIGFIIATIVLLIVITCVNIMHKTTSDVDIWVDTQYGRARVFDSKQENRPIRNLLVSGGYESAMFLDNKGKTELVFDYLKTAAKITRNSIKEDDSVLCLGGGAYSFPKYLAYNKKAKVDVVEIDKEITSLAQKYFFLDEVSKKSKHKINTYTGDGRVVLSDLKTKNYSMIFNDTFAGESPAATLSTLEAAKEIKSSLAPNGLYMMNIMGIYNDAANEFLGWEVKTLREVFGVVRVFHSYDKEHFSSDTQQNWIVVATDNTKWNPPKSSYEVKPNLGGAKILTDDYCPVDYLTARLQFVRER